MAVKKIVSICLAFFIFAVSSICFESKTSAEKVSNSSYTAPITLYWLSKAGVPEAVEYVKYINAEKVLKIDNISQYERVEKINKIYHEIRYLSLNDFIESENYSNVFDLGCGISPRCLYMSQKNINYVGGELKAVVDILNVYAPNFIKEENLRYVKFAVADVENAAEMSNAVKGLKGKVCIVSDDLILYLSRDQQKAMLKNIRSILKKHGGCFITSDFVSGEIFMAANKAIYGDEDALILAKETQKLYEGISETLFKDTIFKTTEEAVKFIEDAGLKVEMYPLFHGKPDIRSIRDLNNRDIESINNMMQQKLLWVITVDGKK